MPKATSATIGILYVLLGLMGFMLGDAADRYHNLLHLATGVVGVSVGLAGSVSGARAFCLAFGIGYLALGGLGFAVGNPSMEYLWDVGLFSVSTPDHIHHLLLGTIILAGGLLPWAGIRGRRALPIADGVSPRGPGR